MSDEQRQKLEVYLQEYCKLKEEQIHRIGFRDNLLYVTLGLFGGILSFALSNQANSYALLVIPWVCLILGWTYLVNDQKISEIGRYIRESLDESIRGQIEIKKNNEQTSNADINKPLFGWEGYHRSDDRRSNRKIEQLIIDQITFVVSGLFALFAFWFSGPNFPLVIHILCSIELIFLLILGVEIILYSDRAIGQ